MTAGVGSPQKSGYQQQGKFEHSKKPSLHNAESEQLYSSTVDVA
jgi:hypothetical protein